MKTKITRQWLEDHHACDDDVEYFNKHYTEINAIKLANKLIGDKKYYYCNWLISKQLTIENCIRYAIYAAELVIDIFETEYPDDDRPRNAIEAAKYYLEHPSSTAAANAAAAAVAATASANATSAVTYTAAANAAAATAAAFAAVNAAAAAANATDAANAATFASAYAAASAGAAAAVSAAFPSATAAASASAVFAAAIAAANATVVAAAAAWYITWEQILGYSIELLKTQADDYE